MLRVIPESAKRTIDSPGGEGRRLEFGICEKVKRVEGIENLNQPSIGEHVATANDDPAAFFYPESMSEFCIGCLAFHAGQADLAPQPCSRCGSFERPRSRLAISRRESAKG